MKSSYDLKLQFVPNRYKFEQGGMLVYDVKAKVCSSFEETSNPISPHLLTPICKPQNNTKYKGICPEDQEMLQKIRKLSSFPQFHTKYNLHIPNDGVTLLFDSKFESGNLLKAIKLSDYEYNLQIRSDFNTKGNNHWYYFSVYNPRKTSVVFNITNMKRPDHLYKSGLKPAVFSMKYSQETQIKWHRDCYSISYTPMPQSEFFKLSFTYNFRYESDTVFFAYSIPYTYSDLCKDLAFYNSTSSDILRINTLCQSLAGTDCPILTITDSISSYIKYNDEVSDWNTSTGGRRLKRLKKLRQADCGQENQHKNKKAIVLTSRVHSGETVSSYMMKGVINFLLSDTKQARVLRKNYVFKIIPMLNPDGVRYGNFRCSLLGVDLNRKWDKPNKILHPTIFYAKKMLQVLSESHNLLFFCDMHGHTRKKNVFMYGCNEKSNDFLVHRKNLLAKVFPVLMAGVNRFFSYQDSHFRIENDKLTTARVVVFKEFDVAHSYTIEASFFGPRAQTAFGEEYYGDMHMTEQNLASVGESLARLFVVFISEKTFYQKIRYVNEFLKAQRNYHKLSQAASLLPNTPNLDDNLDKSLETSILPQQDHKNDNIWEDIDIISDDPSESDSGGSESCPSEHEYVLKRSKSSIKKIIKKDLSTLKKSPSALKIAQNETESITDRPKKPRALQSKTIIAPRMKNNKISVNIPIVSPTIIEHYDYSKNSMPPLKKSLNYSEKLAQYGMRQSNKSVNKLRTPLLISDNSNSHDAKSSRSMLTPRNYKLYNMSWLGPSAPPGSKRLMSHWGVLAEKFCYN